MRKKSEGPSPAMEIKALQQAVEEIKQRLDKLEPKEVNVDDWFGPECLGCDG